ncbi:MAG: hypothetical protein J0H66_13870 [Solirubrobacterales bacterium]|nr:hypothetical protein [Solirubrobacterales bacterium]OJU94493.1 MAG: hypothetical protein BGO23_03580 [Solirubrobacterales bacterium 67-14]
MADEIISDEELAAAVERLSDPGRFREAEQLVSRVAPGLPSVLVTALGSGGWFGESHQSETLKAATIPDEDQRLTAIRALLTEETQMGMMVGVAVGWALRQELENRGAPGASENENEES